MFGDFAILYPHSVQRFEVDFLACWRHTKKATVMGAVVSLKGYRANARPGILAGPDKPFDQADRRRLFGD
jgi:hypothetical protein